MDTVPPRRVYSVWSVVHQTDQVLRELDRDDLNLENQLVPYREGCAHAVPAKQILNSVRAEVDMLIEEADAVHTRGIEAS